MAKIKKNFLTLASAVCCVACLTLAILGLLPKKTVLADTQTEYETATVYDVSQLSANGPSVTTFDASWLDGKTVNQGADAFAFKDLGYAATPQTVDTVTTYEMKSVGVMFQMKLSKAWTANVTSAIRLFICNTEIRWNYTTENGLQLVIFDHNEKSTPDHAWLPGTTDTRNYIEDFDPTVFTTYKIVKTLVKEDTSSYKVDVYINGEHEYETTMFSAITPAEVNPTWSIDQVRIRNNQSNALTVKSAFESAEVKDIYDYQQKNEYLVGKSLTASNNYAFDLRDQTNGSYGEQENFGVSFQLKLNNVKARGEVFRFRTANFDVRLRVATATDNAWFNVYDYTNNTYKTISAKVIFSIDEDAAHTYTFTRQKLDAGEKAVYLYMLSVDGIAKEYIISNYAIAQNSTQNGNYGYFDVTINKDYCDDATFSSAKYYGVEVDGTMNKVNVGESYTLVKPVGDAFCFGFQDAQGNHYAVGDTLNAVASVSSVCVKAENAQGAYVRLLHANESSLKWETTIDKADYDALVEAYGAENVKVSYRIWTAEDTSKEINKVIDINDAAITETAYQFYPLLSKIKNTHFDWEFSYAAYITVTVDGEDIVFTIENENTTRSIAQVAKAAFDDVKTEEQLANLSEEVQALYRYAISVGEDVVYSKFSEAQRAILQQYFVAA